MSTMDHVEEHVEEHGLGQTLTAATVVGTYVGTVSAMTIHGLLAAIGTLGG